MNAIALTAILPVIQALSGACDKLIKVPLHASVKSQASAQKITADYCAV